MANTYVSINTGSILGDIKAALIDKYGSGNVTIHYESSASTSYLIFSCAAIADKVIKVSATTFPIVTWYYGNAWTSGSAITNQVQFSSGSSGMASGHLALGDNFLLLVDMSRDADYKSKVTLLGKLTNGNYIAGGFIGSTYSGARDNCRCVNTTDGVDVRPVSFSGGFLANDGKMYKQPLIFARANGVEVDGGGNLAVITGLENVSYAPGQDVVIVTEDYLIAPTVQYLADYKSYMPTGLFVEF